MKLSSRKQLLNEAEQEIKKIRGKSKKIEEAAVINETAITDRMIGELSKLDPGSKQFLKKLVEVLYEITSEIRSRAYGA
jgi:hypothetical protein